MAKKMSVQVKKCQLRNKPSFLGKIVENLNYADRVTVKKEKDDWMNVAPEKGGTGGWVHVSALSTKKIILNPGSKDVENAASNDELALAGKGFNQQVENDFKKKNKDADFTWVNKMEKFVISQNEMQSFLQKGGLKAEGGDA